MTRTIAFIQARMSSSRFPSKVIEPLQGRPMIVYMAQRVQRARSLDAVVVVTSTDASDDPLAAVLNAAGLPMFRGDLHNVLKRYADAADSYAADVIVRLTGDCPLADPAVIDAVVHARLTAQADYASNIDPPTYPDGFDVECCTRASLERAHREALQQPEREHVTLWMRSATANLHRVNVRAVADFSHLRLTVDYPDDLDVVRRIVSHQEAKAVPDLFDILRVLSEEREFLALNPHARNEGLAKSLGLHPISPGAHP